MSDPQIHKIFDGISAKMKADFEFLSSQFKHNATTGEARETILKDFLRNHLPQQLAIGSGKIISSDGNLSKQIDIIIYDALNTPVLYNSQSNQIIPVECVYGIIEVKSYLNSQALNKSIKNILSVKCMKKKAFIASNYPIKTKFNLHGKEVENFPIISSVFAYSSIKNLKILKNKLVDQDDEVNCENNLDTICILNKGCITNWQTDKDKLMFTKRKNSKRIILVGQNSLLTYYLLSMHLLPQAKMQYPIKIQEYMKYVNIGKILD